MSLENRLGEFSFHADRCLWCLLPRGENESTDVSRIHK